MSKDIVKFLKHQIEKSLSSKELDEVAEVFSCGHCTKEITKEETAELIKRLQIKMSELKG